MQQEITYLDIAVGKNRHEKNWKNKRVTWEDLVTKLSVTHRTAETIEIYAAAPPDRKAEIKDIGGFVGGCMNSGRRKAGSVVFRQLLTLDLDFAKPDQWADFCLKFPTVTACLYSTHSHTPEEPRYRLILPLSRPVSTDEYQAIGRRIAGIIGIDHFDNTGFQPERLMYWPSTSSNGVYEFQYMPGAWLDADYVLATYVNWRNTYEWPVGERYTVKMLGDMKKQGVPTDKPGAIGAFCNAYTMEEALDMFLSDHYVKSEVPHRYTYVHGTTSQGLVIYDNLFAYSHHSTDPAADRLCNAYDLVRLHLFGYLDDSAPVDTPINKLPSNAAMTEYAVKDGRVREFIVDATVNRENARDAFANYIVDGIDTTEIIDEGNTEWKTKLDVDRKGVIQGTINNVILILENDPYLKGRFALNTFEQREVALASLPWRAVDKVPSYLTDTDDAGLRYYFEKVYQITATSRIEDGFMLHLTKNAYNPVRDYLEACRWDGVKRVDTLLIDFLGADDTPYTRIVTRKTLIAAVARIFRPGIKFDNVLTLIGNEGLGKSTIFSILGGPWFSDSFSTVLGKEAYEQIQGVWIVEIPELSGFKRADAEAVKHFIAKRTDRYRVAYGRRTENFDRQCIFIGTTNRIDFLISENGNRRFWPVMVWRKLTPEQQQILLSYAALIWAEAVQYFKDSEILYLTPDMEQQAKLIQSDHTENDDRIGAIEQYANMLVPEEWEAWGIMERKNWLRVEEGPMRVKGVRARGQLCAAEVWVELLDGNVKDMTTHNTKFIHVAFARLQGWEVAKSKRNFKWYGKQKAYVKANEAAVAVLVPA